MNKKRIFIFTALVLAICLVFSMFAVACDNTSENPNTETTETDLLFTNGTFRLTADKAILSSPNNWTGAPGSSSTSSSVGTPNDDDDLTKGVVNTSSSAWSSLQKEYSTIKVASPGRGTTIDSNENLDDNNVLMIHNMTATSYKYTSASHTIKKDSYYKLSVDVKTLDIDKSSDSLAGAYIYVNGSAYAGWEAIDTQGAWKTYTLYIEGSQLADGSITVVLSLGIGAKNTGHMTKGYAFFDNVYLENLSEVDEDDKDDVAFTEADYDKVTVNDTTAKYTMTLADSEFDYASSTTAIPYTPSKYSTVAGYGSGENTSTSSTYIAKGILDTTTLSSSSAKSSLTSLSTLLENKGTSLDKLTTATDAIGSRMLYLQNKSANAFGYRASVAMNFDSNSYYKLSVWANTYLVSGSASIRLTNGTSEDSNNYTIDGISTDGQWTQYTFYIAGNQFRSNELYLELWLGFGGQNDTSTHAEGAVFFDSVTMTTIDKAAYDSAAESNQVKKISLMSSEENMTGVDLSIFSTQNTDENISDGKFSYKVIDTANFTAGAGNGDYFTENPGKPVEFESDIFNASVLGINNYYPTASTISNFTYDGTSVNKNSLFEIAPNKAYAISMYVKTVNVDSALGLNVSLLKVNKDYKDTQEFADAYTSLSSFANLNTENLSDYKGYNDYTMITFYVLGAQLESNQLALSFSLGSGTGSDYSTLATGFAYVSNIYVESITYTEYSSATSSTTVNTAKLTDTAGSSEVSSNGYFNYIDISGTEKLYGNDVFANDGTLNSVLGAPSSWTLNNSSALSKEAQEDGTYKSMAGILNLNNTSQLTALGITTDNFYNGAEKFFNTTDNSNVLAIKKDDNADVKVLGYTSNSISLTAKSYYVFNVWAKADVNNQFSIILKTSTANSDSFKFANLTGDGSWHMYSIFVETGISSTSVTLSLNAGTNIGTSTSSTVFFTAATYATVNSSAFENAENSQIADLVAQSWLVDSFDDVADAESIASPNNWTGALVDSDASSDSDTIAHGVIDKNKTDFSDIDLNPDDPADEAIINTIFNDKTGDNVLVIYNKDNTAYGYTSNSATLEGGKYYKISISVLTYMLAVNGDAEDLDANFLPTATITLKANNKTYVFGRKLTSTATDDDKTRIVNTSTYAEDGTETIGNWTEYSFYIFAEEDIEDTTATLTVSLGFEGENYYLTGYVFADNFSVEEINADEFIAREEVYVEDENGTFYKNGEEYVEISDSNPAPEGATLYKKLNDNEVADYDNSLNSVLADKSAVKNNYRIVFTSDDSTAEPEEETPEETPTEEPNSLVWLYVVSGVVSVIIVAIVVIFLIKKYAPKRSKKLVKSKKSTPAAKKSNKRDQFGK